MPKITPFEDRYMPEPNTGCFLWLGEVDKDGYGKLHVARTGTRVAHRIAWQRAHGKIPCGALVCHRCDTPSCVNPNHLFLGSQRDNIRDAVRKGRMSSGDRHYKRKKSDATLQ